MTEPNWTAEQEEHFRHLYELGTAVKLVRLYAEHGTDGPVEAIGLES